MITAEPLEPVIKWSGSKRSIARRLAALFSPCRAYYEPFVGGGAMLPYRTANVGYAGDMIPELIALWKAVRDEPETTAETYRRNWHRLQQEGYQVYYEIRDTFNRSRDPHCLLFLSRTCVNGLIRFNRNGDFNNSLHHTRPGIDPDRLQRIIGAWSRVVQGVEFFAQDYRATLAGASVDALAFLDPPYGGTRGRYHPAQFNFDEFFGELDRLNQRGVRWVLTLDGAAGDREYGLKVPAEFYKVRLALPTGNSPFTKLMNMSVDAVVESVYLNFEPRSESLRFAEQGFGNKARPFVKSNRQRGNAADFVSCSLVSASE